MLIRVLLGLCACTLFGYLNCALGTAETQKPVTTNKPQSDKPNQTHKPNGALDVPTVDPGALLLIWKQNQEFPNIINELNTHGKKVHHWIWWVHISNIKRLFCHKALYPSSKFAIGPRNLEYMGDMGA